MTDFEAQVLADLSVLKSQMEQVMGIGQPGRLHHLERRVARTEHGVHRMKGYVAAFGAVLTIAQLAIRYISEKHN